ncbi:MAG: RND family transporter [Flavobacteriales bacterium]
MWTLISRIILRNRILLLVLLGLLTAFMSYKAKDAQVSYEFGGLLPKDDSTYQVYQEYRNYFPKDGNIMVLGINSEDLYQKKEFNAWYQLGKDIKAIDGVDSVFSEAHLYGLRKHPEKTRFQLYPLMKDSVSSASEMKELKATIRDFPFYKGLIYNDSTEASLMMIYLERDILDEQKRMEVVHKVQELGKSFSKKHPDLHYSGLPYIRTVVTDRVQSELRLFLVLAVLVTAGILFFFFRSFRVVLFSLLVVGVGVVWSLGTIALFGFKLSIVMVLIPPLIIVIGIPNCVFLLNKYHNEFVEHGNKIKAITRIIHRIGNATFLTNTTTALGFATFIFTESSVLQEFGIIASINILGIFVFSLLIIPIVYSFLPEPKTRHTSHLRRPWIRRIVEQLTRLVVHYRPWVYGCTIGVLLLSGLGITFMKTSGRVADDLPKNDPVQKDIRFFQRHFNGILPFEVFIDAGKKGVVNKPSMIRKLDALQDSLAKRAELSPSLSLANGVKFARQAFFKGNPERYGLIRPQERAFIAPYLTGKGSNTIMGGMTDSSERYTRVSAKVGDIGTIKMNEMLKELRPAVDSIFDKERSEVAFTGSSVLFFKGTEYLVKNLFISLGIAIVLIAFIMALLFGTVRMVLLSLIPNLIPLIITAALMGYFEIFIKPSTVLVFSIAFGISVDDTIHYLAKYRQELKMCNGNVREAVLLALKETGVSMFYTSVVLFFGFAVFIASSFGGNQAIGILVSLTLFIAMFANLVLLPSMLISFQRRIAPKGPGEPVLEDIADEDASEAQDPPLDRNPNGKGASSEASDPSRMNAGS